MELRAQITDNITELLVKIIEFTQVRHKILTLNINSIHKPGFIPMDLAVYEFSGLLNIAINEHTRNHRLVLCDTENIKFGAGGSFKAAPVVDKYAKELLEENKDEYIELQINKLLKNSMNRKAAAELLRQKQKLTPIKVIDRFY
jgi:flagellar basal body rod protein FlgB